MYVHICINEFLSEAGFLELTDYGQVWQNQEISWENAVFLQEISWHLLSCFLFSYQEMCHSILNFIKIPTWAREYFQMTVIQQKKKQNITINIRDVSC